MQAWTSRRKKVAERRATLWKQRDSRYGHSLLEVVEEQGGVCGNRAKDKGAYGCGVLLYGHPPGSIHMDHVHPRAHGGDDRRENLQALCQSCNLLKSSKLGPKKGEGEEPQRKLLMRRRER